MQWKLFANLAEVAGSKHIDVEVDDGATVEDALEALVGAHPALEARILDEDGTLSEHINVLQNGRNVFAVADGLDTAVDCDDELALFPPVSGGCGPGTVR